MNCLHTVTNVVIDVLHFTFLYTPDGEEGKTMPEDDIASSLTSQIQFLSVILK